MSKRTVRSGFFIFNHRLWPVEEEEECWRPSISQRVPLRGVINCSQIVEIGNSLHKEISNISNSLRKAIRNSLYKEISNFRMISHYSKCFRLHIL